MSCSAAQQMTSSAFKTVAALATVYANATSLSIAAKLPNPDYSRAWEFVTSRVMETRRVSEGNSLVGPRLRVGLPLARE